MEDKEEAGKGALWFAASLIEMLQAPPFSVGSTSARNTDLKYGIE